MLLTLVLVWFHSPCAFSLTAFFTAAGFQGTTGGTAAGLWGSLWRECEGDPVMLSVFRGQSGLVWIEE